MCVYLIVYLRVGGCVSGWVGVAPAFCFFTCIPRPLIPIIDPTDPPLSSCVRAHTQVGPSVASSLAGRLLGGITQVGMEEMRVYVT